MLEEAAGAVDEARRLLRRASKVDPRHLHVWQAWGCLEYRQQNYEKGALSGVVLWSVQRSVKGARRAPHSREACSCGSRQPAVPSALGHSRRHATPLLHHAPVARELFQQGIWATPPRAPAVSLVFQASWLAGC